MLRTQDKNLGRVKYMSNNFASMMTTSQARVQGRPEGNLDGGQGAGREGGDESTGFTGTEFDSPASPADVLSLFPDAWQSYECLVLGFFFRVVSWGGHVGSTRASSVPTGPGF